MTFGAIPEISNVCFKMNGGHITWRMIVTAVAGVGGVIGGVAHLAIQVLALVAVIDGKGVLDQARGTPTGNGMTRGTIGAELSFMR